MAMILIPVLLALLLGPGMGQLYNKEYKKAIVLIVLSIGVLLAFSVWLGRAAMAYLPTDISQADRNVLRSIIQDHIIVDRPLTFYTYEVVLAVLWLYGVVDAYIGGMRRRAQKMGGPTTPVV